MLKGEKTNLNVNQTFYYRNGDFQLLTKLDNSTVLSFY